MLLAQIYPAWGIILHGELYPLPMWEQDTLGGDFGGLQLETFPTPRAHEHKQSVTLKTLSLHTLDLLNYCNVYPTACCNGLRTGSQVVSRVKSLKGVTDEEKQDILMGNGGKLNPDFVEWLMGFPIGWTQLSEGSFGRRTS